MGKVTNLESLTVEDLDSTYAVAGGSKKFKKPASRNKTFSVQVIWAGLDAFDGIMKAQGSNNNVDFDDLPSPNSIVLDSANGHKSLLCRTEFDFAHLAIDYNVGAAGAGTVKLLLNDN